MRRLHEAAAKRERRDTALTISSGTPTRSSSGDALHIERALAITQPVMPSPTFMRRRCKELDVFAGDMRGDRFSGLLVDHEDDASVERHDRSQLVRDQSDCVVEIQ